MPVSLTNRQAIDAKDGIALLGGIDLDIEVAYPVAIIKRKLEGQLTDITAVQKDLFAKYGKKDAEGRLVQSKNDAGGVVTELTDASAFSAEWDRLMAQAQELDVPVLTKAMLAGIKVKPDALFLLGPLFQEK